MTRRLTRIAGAKINLALHVMGRKPDGYHALEMVVVHTVDGDELWVEPADRLSLTVTGPFGDRLSNGSDNLVLRAAAALDGEFAAERGSDAPRGAAITLVKNLPLASGIGGGSADAAAAIHLLVALWQLPDDRACCLRVCAALGEDVPLCFLTYPKQLSARAAGEYWQDLHDPQLRFWPTLLVNPLVEVPTPAAFACWDGVVRGGLPAVAHFADLARARNDLTSAAVTLAPAVDDVLAELATQRGVVLSRMSGSGATCFALFDSAAARDTARDAIAAAHPEWWLLATRLT